MRFHSLLTDAKHQKEPNYTKAFGASALFRSVEIRSHLKNKSRHKGARLDQRRGAFTVLAAFVLIMVSIVAALCINVAYIELSKSEMRLATDAAAKAASITLGRTGDIDIAREMGRQVCRYHNVAGSPLEISNSNIQFGNAIFYGDGSYGFRDGIRPFNAVRIQASFSERAGGAERLLAFGGLLGSDTFQLEQTSIACRIDNDICLVVDRSGSMAWDTTNEAYSYPGVQYGQSIIQNYFEPPHATLSRWAAVDAAVDTFLDVLDNNPYQPRVGLVTYASNFDFGLYLSSVSTVDQDLTYDFNFIRSAIEARASHPIIGNTNIAAGLRDGISVLSSASSSRPSASHNIVLLTDGIMTQGDDPIALAAVALSRNISIHTITFSDQADQELMQRVAEAGGGEHYHAPDATTLNEVFRGLAETLPAMLVQ